MRFTITTNKENAKQIKAAMEGVVGRMNKGLYLLNIQDFEGYTLVTLETCEPNADNLESIFWLVFFTGHQIAWLNCLDEKTG